MGTLQENTLSFLGGVKHQVQIGGNGIDPTILKCLIYTDL